jgi:hypothetical protein
MDISLNGDSLLKLRLVHDSGKTGLDDSTISLGAALASIANRAGEMEWEELMAALQPYNLSQPESRLFAQLLRHLGDMQEAHVAALESLEKLSRRVPQ